VYALGSLYHPNQWMLLTEFYRPLANFPTLLLTSSLMFLSWWEHFMKTTSLLVYSVQSLFPYGT